MRLITLLLALPLAAQSQLALTWSAYLGEAGAERTTRPVVDSAGNIYITGRAVAGLPTQAGAYQPAAGGGTCFGGKPPSPPPVPCGDAFVMKLSADGTRVLAATYLGGSGEDSTWQIGIDGQDSIYVLGTSPTLAATTGAFLQTPGTFSANEFVAKFDPALSKLLYLTRLENSASDMAVDSAGNVYLTGSVRKSTQPGVDAEDAYVLKLAADGSRVVYSYVFGGSAPDVAYAITVDDAGAAYLIGSTRSPEFPFTPNAYDRTLGSYAIFIAKMKPAGDGLEAATYFPGGATAIAVDSAHSVYVAGVALAGFPTTTGAPQTVNKGGLGDAFVAKLDPALSRIVYATYLGGTAYDLANGIAVDAGGNAIVVGHTFSLDYPTVSPVQSVLRGARDGFVAVVNPQGTAFTLSTYLGGFGADQANGVAALPGGGLAVLGCAADVCRTTSALINFVASVDSGSFPITSGAFSQSTDRAGLFVTKFAPSAVRTPLIFANGIANLASSATMPLAPGEFISILGTNLSGTTRVLIGGISAPLLMTSADQVNVAVPFGVTFGKPADIVIESGADRSTPVSFDVAQAAPGVFCIGPAAHYSCLGAILNEDSTVNGPLNPARAGSVISFYATGLGQTTPTSQDNAVAKPPYATVVMKPEVTVSGLPAEVLYAGVAPGMISGVYQVNVRLPATVAGDEYPLVVRSGDLASVPVAINIR